MNKYIYIILIIPIAKMLIDLILVFLSQKLTGIPLLLITNC